MQCLFSAEELAGAKVRQINEALDDERTHNSVLHICDLHLTDLSIKPTISVILFPDRLQDMYFDEENELMVEIDGEIFTYHGGLCKYRE